MALSLIKVNSSNDFIRAIESPRSSTNANQAKFTKTGRLKKS